MPAADAQPADGWRAKRSTERSAMPRCMAALQNQEKNTMPQKLTCATEPAGGVRSSQTSKVSRRPRVTQAQATKTKNIHGAA